MNEHEFFSYRLILEASNQLLEKRSKEATTSEVSFLRKFELLREKVLCQE